MQKENAITFSTDDNAIEIIVNIGEETVWLNLNQMAELFERDKSVISKHLKNIFKNGELEEKSTVANFATVQIEGGHSVERNIDYYNLDAILSVGYRVNSKRGTQFRKWASLILKDYLIKGYALHQKTLYQKGFKDLNRAIDLLSNTLTNQNLIEDTGKTALSIIQSYASTWSLLLEYDENKLSINQNLIDDSFPFDYQTLIHHIDHFKASLMNKSEASTLFGQQKDDHLLMIFDSIHQTFDSLPLYTSYIERAAHLLYFVIKDHPFIDGNKRIGSFLFVLYLKSFKCEKLSINTKTLVALALLIAESAPSDKELMIKLISNLIEKDS